MPIGKYIHIIESKKSGTSTSDAFHQIFVINPKAKDITDIFEDKKVTLSHRGRHIQSAIGPNNYPIDGAVSLEDGTIIDSKNDIIFSNKNVKLEVGLSPCVSLAGRTMMISQKMEELIIGILTHYPPGKLYEGIAYTRRVLKNIFGLSIEDLDRVLCGGHNYRNGLDHKGAGSEEIRKDALQAIPTTQFVHEPGRGSDVYFDGMDTMFLGKGKVTEITQPFDSKENREHPPYHLTGKEPHKILKI